MSSNEYPFEGGCSDEVWDDETDEICQDDVPTLRSIPAAAPVDEDNESDCVA